MEVLIPLAMLLATLFVVLHVAFTDGDAVDHDVRNTDLRRPA